MIFFGSGRVHDFFFGSSVLAVYLFSKSPPPPLSSQMIRSYGPPGYEVSVNCYFFPPAINDSCLVFDGRLVIDADFHTNDPCIRAAGPLTKFQRRYHAESW